MKKIALTALITAAALLFSASGVFAAGDPVESYSHIDAEYEDSGISLWFDYASEKAARTDVADTGMETFEVQMAKNEIENAQFFLSADTAREGMTAGVTDFKNAAGDTIPAELFIEYYHDCGTLGSLPDAIPPLDAYGPFALQAGTSQGFLIKLRSTEQTAAGQYSAMLSVFDSAGHEVKRAEVFANVWDITLSEATECATSINLSYDYLVRAVTDTALTEKELYTNYYNYLLENRISSYYLPENIYNANAEQYLDNPRVTSYQLKNISGANYTDAALKRIYTNVFAGEDNAHRFDKAYQFGTVVDADSAADLEALRADYDSFTNKISSIVPSYASVPVNFISTYIFDIDYTKPDNTVIDQIEYYSDFVNLWCSKTFAFTDPDELTVPGAKLLQPLKWNSVYGTFKERMAAKQAAGQKVWWFISWDVEAPYINYYIQTDGVAQRLLFWQQYDNGVEGFLYNFANFWIGDAVDPYNHNLTNTDYPQSYGESILIYPGDDYGLDIPVGSLRIEAMRDGIEDYQLFSMLEDIRGEGAADDIIESMTTGMVRYSTDDSAYYSARESLLSEIDRAINGGECEHEYEGGVCIHCGEADPDYIPPYAKGDVNNDNAINSTDIIMVKMMIMRMFTPSGQEYAAADIDQSGAINLLDLFSIMYYIFNGSWGA